MNEPLREDRRYPLSWPAGWPRRTSRQRSKFGDRSFAQARDALLHELDLLGAKHVILSTNLELRVTDGLPRSGQRQPNDPGVAVYFKRSVNGTMTDYALACDKWACVEDNTYALAKHVEALRGQQRWGVGSVEQAFAGFRQLAAPRTGASWREVLKVSADFPKGTGLTTTALVLSFIDDRFKELAKERHPDVGGSNEAMAALIAARDAARAELGGP